MAPVEIPVPQRLIVAGDFKPNVSLGMTAILDVAQRLEAFAATLARSGVVLKFNSVLRALGFHTLGNLRQRHMLHSFPDLKLIDISETMETDAMLLAPYEPLFLTVMCCAGVKGMRKVKETLVAHGSPNTIVLGVTVLTSLDDEECEAIFGAQVNPSVLKFARMALQAGIDGLILSPKEVALIRQHHEFDRLVLVTPGIRPAWAAVGADDQKRVMAPFAAILAGADCIVVGRPITQAENPADAVRWTLVEIEEGLVARAAQKEGVPS